MGAGTGRAAHTALRCLQPRLPPERAGARCSGHRCSTAGTPGGAWSSTCTGAWRRCLPSWRAPASKHSAHRRPSREAADARLRRASSRWRRSRRPGWRCTSPWARCSGRRSPPTTSARSTPWTPGARRRAARGAAYPPGAGPAADGRGCGRAGQVFAGAGGLRRVRRLPLRGEQHLHPGARARPGPAPAGRPAPVADRARRRARRRSWRPLTARAAQRCRWTCAARSRATAWWWPLRYAPPAPAPQRRSCTAVCASPSARARAVRARSPQRPWRRRWPSACCCWRGGRRRRPCAGRRWPRRGCARPSAWSCWARAWRPACRLPACGRAARRPEPPLPLSPRAAQVEGAPRRAQADLLALERSRVAELQALAAQLRAALAKAGYTEAAGAGAGCARGAAHAWQGLARALSPHAARAARRPAEEGKQVAGWAGPAAGAPDPLNLLGLAPAAGDLDKAGALSAHGPESPLLRIAVPGLSEQPPVASPDSPGDEKKKARRISAAADASLLGRLEGRSGDARRAPPRRSGRRSGTWSWRSTRQARTPPTPRRTPRTRLSEALRAG